MTKYKYSNEVVVKPSGGKLKMPCDECGEKMGMAHTTTCGKFICSRCRKKDYEEWLVE